MTHSILRMTTFSLTFVRVFVTAGTIAQWYFAPQVGLPPGSCWLLLEEEL